MKNTTKNNARIEDLPEDEDNALVGLMTKAINNRHKSIRGDSGKIQNEKSCQDKGLLEFS